MTVIRSKLVHKNHSLPNMMLKALTNDDLGYVTFLTGVL